MEVPDVVPPVLSEPPQATMAEARSETESEAAKREHDEDFMGTRYTPKARARQVFAGITSS
jgi:hypothetical protein